MFGQDLSGMGLLPSFSTTFKMENTFHGFLHSAVEDQSLLTGKEFFTERMGDTFYDFPCTAVEDQALLNSNLPFKERICPKTSHFFA